MESNPRGVIPGSPRGGMIANRPLKFTQAVRACAGSYFGVGYKLGGQTDDALDCSGLIVQILRSLGFNLKDRTAEDLRCELFSLQSPPDVGASVPALFRMKGVAADHVMLVVSQAPSGFIVFHTTADQGYAHYAFVPNGYGELRYLDLRLVISDMRG